MEFSNENSNVNWDRAGVWEREANTNKLRHSEPIWSFDCSFKLDFDGPVLKLSSRFYPPTSEEGDNNWDGTATLYFYDETLEDKEFKAPTLEELKTQVETWYREYSKSIAEIVKAVVKLKSQGN